MLQPMKMLYRPSTVLQRSVKQLLFRLQTVNVQWASLKLWVLWSQRPRGHGQILWRRGSVGFCLQSWQHCDWPVDCFVKIWQHALSSCIEHEKLLKKRQTEQSMFKDACSLIQCCFDTLDNVMFSRRQPQSTHQRNDDCTIFHITIPLQYTQNFIANISEFSGALDALIGSDILTEDPDCETTDQILLQHEMCTLNLWPQHIPCTPKKMSTIVDDPLLFLHRNLDCLVEVHMDHCFVCMIGHLVSCPAVSMCGVVWVGVVTVSTCHW